MNEYSNSWKDRHCCFQQTGKSNITEDIMEPQRTLTEGKVILTPRHKSSDELLTQLKQLPHRRSMPAHRYWCAHARFKIRTAERVRPKANARKSSIHKVTRPADLVSCSVSFLCCYREGVKMRNVEKKKTCGWFCCQPYVTWGVRTVPQGH